ncbi:MAG: tRNA epoxyqueuosine(34) reductase QueG [Abditibacteriaceae bacterium]
MPETLNSSVIKAKAHELGFAVCGIASPEPLRTQVFFENWISNGMNATMDWMAKEESVAKRSDLKLIMPEVQSVICMAMHYRTHGELDKSTFGGIARYAQGNDYHDFMTKRLRELLHWIQEQTECVGRVYVDTGPVLERELAQRAGIGWAGKNTLIMSRELGSYFLLGEILVDLPLQYDEPYWQDYCGTCTACIDACPTDALKPHELDANRCISYHTIENLEEPPSDLVVNFGDWIFGCDACQEVCPWNHKSTFTSEEPHLWQRQQMPALEEWEGISQEDFSARLSKSPIKRAKRAGMQRNAAIAVSNEQKPKVLL